MKLLITGASSTLGENLTSELLKIGKFSIRLLVHHSPVSNEHCEILKGDLQDIDSLVNACSGIDAVVHLAALTHSPSTQAYFNVNVRGTENLLAACHKNNVKRFIFVSSSAASKVGGEYGVSKLQGEERVKNSSLDWVIVRPSEVYGPNMEEGIGKLISWIKKFPVIPVIGDGSYFLSPVYVNDIVHAMLEVIKKDSLEKETLNLCGPEKMTMNELIDRLAQIHRVQRKKIFLPVWLVRMGIAILSMIKSDVAFSDQIPRLLCEKDRTINATQAIIPYKPRNIEEGLFASQAEKA
ncbi:MAG: NAD-dependent epimerase/dehydratase family protein [Nitrospinae bacterium]|nr:NAD-dependent epimerase/dehydratase family protein [Nitrospinota bacterium]